jgi:hypothetical protein
MVEVPKSASIVRYTPTDQADQTKKVEGSRFSPYKNARILFKNIENELNNFFSRIPLEERLQEVRDRFLTHPAISNLSSKDKASVINRAQEIFKVVKANKLSDKQQSAVDKLFQSLTENLALQETAKVAQQHGVTTVNPQRQILKAASAMQGGTDELFRCLEKLLESAHITYLGKGIVPDVYHNLAQLLEDHLDLSPVNQGKNNNHLQKVFITILKVADYHFKFEKDDREPSSYDSFAKFLKGGGHGRSNYEELGRLSAEPDGITLRKDFAKALENLLKDYQIVRTANQFKDTAYPYLNTLALEAAADKTVNPL